MSDLVHDILRDLLWELFWPPMRDWCERRRGESVEANWRRCGIWFAPFFALFGGAALLFGILGGGWIWVMCGPIVAGCAWVVGRWLLAIGRCEREKKLRELEVLLRAPRAGTLGGRTSRRLAG